MKNWHECVIKLYTCFGIFGLTLKSVVSNEFNCPIGCICTEIVARNFTQHTSMSNTINECSSNSWRSILSSETDWDARIPGECILDKKFKLLYISCKHLPPSSEFFNVTMSGFDLANRIIFSYCSGLMNNEDSKNMDEIMKQVNMKHENLVSVNFYEESAWDEDEDVNVQYVNVLELFIDDNEPKRVKAHILQDFQLIGHGNCTDHIPFQFFEIQPGNFKVGLNYVTDLYIDVIFYTLKNYFPNMTEVYMIGNDFQELKALNSKNCNISGWIYVSKNNVRKIDKSILPFLPSKSHKEKIVDDSFEEYPLAVNFRKGFLYIILGENPMDCGCHIYPFLDYFTANSGIDVSGTTCYTPRELRYTELEYLHAHNYTCHLINEDSNYDDPCSKTVGCICTFTPIDNAITVDCSSKTFTELPNLSYLESFHHVTLNMEDNRLSKVVINGTSPALKSLEYLKLGMNAITKFYVNSLPPKLKVLELHGNELTGLDAKTLDILSKSNMDDITLHDNPWHCDCSTVNLITLIEIKVADSKNSRRIRCQLTRKALLSLSKAILCSDYVSIIIYGIFVTIIGLFLGSVIAIYYRFRKRIQLWLWSKSICVTSFEEDDDCDWIYDIFISYSHKDEDFVVQELMPKLENGPKPYKVCVRFRDWLVDEYIPVQIERSVRKSKWTILIVSQNFVTSVWDKLEFQTAHRQALNNMKSRIIVILYGDIHHVEDLDAELKAYINISRTIKWEDSYFWEKLQNII